MENSAMEFSLDGEMESLCNIFTFDQPNFCDDFLGHSIYNEYYYHNNPSNFLPPNQNYFSFYNDSISNTDLSDNASDSTSYNKVSQITNNDCYQNYSHFLSQSDAFFPINISSLTEQEDNSSVNLESPLKNEVPLKRKHNNTLERVEGEPRLPKKRARVSKDRGNNCIEAKNCNDDNRNDSSKEENSDDRELSKACEQVSEGESSALTEISKGTKKRASRGEATDPQSLYARRRREKINQRLKILQSLVPNGTKVDISTMLEEALHYVKFLQRQIRLLSSDELWMYAPIAYNGVDMSLYKGISPFLLP